MGGGGGARGLQLLMSWQPSLLSQKRKTGPPLGLRNLGNSCYLNSVLQCLTYTPPLANFCLRLQHSSLCDAVSSPSPSSDNSKKQHQQQRDCPFCLLEKRIARSLTLDLPLDTPAKIQSCLRIFAEHFRGGRQEDAHEFLRYVIDACHNTCLRLKKLQQLRVGGGGGGGGGGGDGNTVVKEIFGGSLQSQVKCLSCKSESNKVDEIMDISLDVLHSNSLRESLEKFFQPEILDGNNKYKCESCKKLVAARKQMSILQAPNILVVQLKRFEGIFGGKIDRAIAFEEVLLLSSFMCKASQDLQPEYKLFGTIVHSGFSQESGHYYAFIKDAVGRWYCCNDSFVTLSSLQDVLSEKVYILFFSRTNQRPVSVGTSFATNGVKSRDSNGTEASRNPRAAVPPKAPPTKSYGEQPARKDISAPISTGPQNKVDKIVAGPRVKLNLLGNSGPKRVPPTVNGKVHVHKCQNVETNGHAKDSVSMEKLDNGTSSVINRNGAGNSKRVNAVDGDPCHGITVTSENGRIENGASDSQKAHLYEGNGGENGRTENGSADSQRPHVCEGNGTIKRFPMVKGPGHRQLQNGSGNGCADIPGSKRKLKDNPCILLEQDTQSRAKVERLKEVLKQEATSVLRSCGWYDKVYHSMSLRKRLCAGGAPGRDDLKKALIGEAKSTFISQIPQSLKEDLVKHLQLFSDEK